MNEYHQELVILLIKNSGKGTSQQLTRQKNYVGTSKKYYVISNPVKNKIVKDWIRKNATLNLPEFTELLNSLCQGESHDEITLGGMFLKALPKLRKQLKPDLINNWLENTEGWAEIDSLCQSVFPAEQILNDWTAWKKLISGLLKSNKIQKRRASLVLLTGPVKKSPDVRLSGLAFANISVLTAEKAILITKAISWLLRDLIKNHRKEVADYLKQNSDKLPKIAIRETMRKLRTGRK